MNDLGQQLRDLFEAAGPPLDIEAIVARGDRSAARRHRVRAIGAVAAAAALVVAGLFTYVLLLPEGSPLPVVDDPPATDRRPTETGSTRTELSETTGAAAGRTETAPSATTPTEPALGAGSDATAPATDLRPGASPSSQPSSDHVVPTPPSGRILYESGEVIRTVEVGDGEPRDIAAGVQPRWSRDGTRISFRDDAGLWTALSDGTARTQVAGPEVDLDGAPFSPDGSRVLYTVGHWNCGPDSALVPPFGCAPSSDAGVWSVRVDGRNPRRLATGAAWHAVWSPDGTRVAYSRDGAIHVARSDGSDQQLLFQPQAGDQADRPRFSPDGTRLAFFVTIEALSGQGSSDPCGPSMELWTVNTDGTSAGPLTRGRYRPGTAGGAYVRAPQWSPDGTMITFADTLDVWVVDVADGAARSVMTTSDDDCASVADADPAWSPDGQFRRGLLAGPGWVRGRPLRDPA